MGQRVTTGREGWGKPGKAFESRPKPCSAF